MKIVHYVEITEKIKVPEHDTKITLWNKKELQEKLLAFHPTLDIPNTKETKDYTVYKFVHKGEVKNYIFDDPFFNEMVGDMTAENRKLFHIAAMKGKQLLYANLEVNRMRNLYMEKVKQLQKLQRHPFKSLCSAILRKIKIKLHIRRHKND